MAARVPCKNTDCLNSILQDTADRNEGLCMPCVQSILDQEHKEHVRTNRRDINEFDGVIDSVEILTLVHKPRKFDELVNWIPHPTPIDQLYRNLNSDEELSLAVFVSTLVAPERCSEAEDICLCLAAFTDALFDDCLRRLVANDLIWPSLPFHRSPSDVRESLLARVTIDSANRDHILCALAWIGDPRVVEQFESWRNNPPKWSDSLFIPPENYARQAGWELTGNGQKRDLYFTICYSLVKGASELQSDFQAVIERSDTCPWCHSNLIDLFTVEPSLLGIDWEGLLRIPTCENCTAFGTVFGRVSEDGEAAWSSKNSRPSYLPDDMDSWEKLPRNSLRIDMVRPAVFAADRSLPTTFSQLGGHPSWEQDAEYSTCPDCSMSMMFLAQINHEEIEDFSEGIYYAFICPPCRTTATSYQQT